MLGSFLFISTFNSCMQFQISFIFTSKSIYICLFPSVPYVVNCLFTNCVHGFFFLLSLYLSLRIQFPFHWKSCLRFAWNSNINYNKVCVLLFYINTVVIYKIICFHFLFLLQLESYCLPTTKSPYLKPVINPGIAPVLLTVAKISLTSFVFYSFSTICYRYDFLFHSLALLTPSVKLL